MRKEGKYKLITFEDIENVKFMQKVAIEAHRVGNVSAGIAEQVIVAATDLRTVVANRDAATTSTREGTPLFSTFTVLTKNTRGDKE